MNISETTLPGVLLLDTAVFRDARGHFFESYNERAFQAATGTSLRFVQDNISRSMRQVLRGLHYQVVQPQGKLVRVLAGEIFDVAVDVRRSSPHLGKWAGFRLSSSENRAAWIPPGFAHGFLVLSESADVLYKTTDYYAPGHERTILWSDPRLGIRWPLDGQPILSAKDERGTDFAAAELYEGPVPG